MSGELILEQKSLWRTALALAVSCALSAGVTAALCRHLPMEGMAMLISVALITYILFRVLYPAAVQLFPQKGDGRVKWTIAGDVLTLGEDAIPLDSIKMVHCWPNRDALGNKNEGWTVNIETTGKNRVLRSLPQGEQAAESLELLRELVEDLGFGDRWVEQEMEL